MWPTTFYGSQYCPLHDSLEAGGLERHELSSQYNKMCLVAMPDGHARLIACVCSPDDITCRIELLRCIQLDSEHLNWLAHAATFRIIWGEVAEDTHGGAAKVSAPAFLAHLRLVKILPSKWKSSFVQTQCALPKAQPDLCRPLLSMPNACTMKV